MGKKLDASSHLELKSESSLQSLRSLRNWEYEIESLT